MCLRLWDLRRLTRPMKIVAAGGHPPERDFSSVGHEKLRLRSISGRELRMGDFLKDVNRQDDWFSGFMVGFIVACLGAWIMRR